MSDISSNSADSTDPNALVYDPTWNVRNNSSTPSAPPSPPPSYSTPPAGPGFGSASSNNGTRSSRIAIIGVVTAGLILWFYSSSPNALWERFVKIWHTLSDILLHPPDESKLIIIVLLAMTTAALVQMWHDQKQVGQEEAALEALRLKLRRQQGRIDLTDLTAALQNQPSQSVLVRAVQAVWQARNLQTPDLEAISAAVFVLEAKRTGLGRSVANRLLLLSLLGTVIGLAGVIGTLQTQIGSASGGDPEVLLRQLQGTLTTMGTAFASTAYGIILCVFVAAQTSRANERRSHHVAEVQYFAVCELAPSLLPVSLPQAISQIESLVWQSGAFVAESRTLLDETRVQNVAYLQDLDKKTRESAQMTANVVAGIETTIRAAAQEVHNALADAGKYVVEGAKAQITVAKSLDKLLGESTTSMENAAANLKTGLSGLSNASTTVQSAYKGLNSAVTDLKASLDGQAQSIGDAARGRIAEATALATAQQASAKQAAEAASAAAAAQQASLKRVSDDITVSLTNLTAQITEFVRRTEPKMPSDQEWSRLQKTLDRCAEASTSFSSAVGRLEKDGFTSASPRPAAGGNAGITSAEMQQLLGAVTRQVTDSISTAPQPLREDLRVFSQDIRQVIQRMEQMSRQAAPPRYEQTPYRPPSSTAEPRPQVPYGDRATNPVDVRYEQPQRPVPTELPTQRGVSSPVRPPDKRGPAWWPFGKKE